METNYYLTINATTTTSIPAGSFAAGRLDYQTLTFPATQPFVYVDPALVSMLEDLYPPTDSEIAARFGLDYLHPNTDGE